MNNSEVTNYDSENQNEIYNTIEKLSPSLNPTILLLLKSVEYFFLAAFVCTGITTFVFSSNQFIVIWLAAFFSIWIFFILINKQVWSNLKLVINQSDIAKRAALYNYLSANTNSSVNNSLIPARSKALQYCQQLVEDHKETRRSSRNLYYSLQLATVILSGLTPIFVLVDKLVTDIVWFKWLPVIFPAVASIVASVATSFPFQENWIAANTAVELLEAEQEKFILGVTEAYRCYDVDDEIKHQQKAKQAIENFIIQVNNIHLKQVQGPSETKSTEERTRVQSANLNQEQA